MKSEIFGSLTTADYDDAKTAFEGEFQPIGKHKCEFSIRGEMDSTSLVEWAEERYRLFRSNFGRIRQNIQDWIPTYYQELGCDLNSDPGDMLDALKIDCFHFVQSKKHVRIWFYGNVDGGIDDRFPDPLLGHDIVISFNEKMDIILFDTDG